MRLDVVERYVEQMRVFVSQDAKLHVSEVSEQIDLYTDEVSINLYECKDGWKLEVWDRPDHWKVLAESWEFPSAPHPDEVRQRLESYFGGEPTEMWIPSEQDE